MPYYGPSVTSIPQIWNQNRVQLPPSFWAEILCLAYIFCVPFVYLGNVCSFSLLFSYVTVLARLSQVLLHIKIK